MNRTITPTIKYPSIQHLDEISDILDHPVQVFEKLDGGNCQIGAGLGRLLLATRSGDYSNRTREHLWFGQFQSWANRFYAELQRDLVAPLEELLPTNLVLFGEWLSAHTLDYRPDAVNQFYLIDVYDLHAERFLPYEQGVAKATVDGLLPLRTLVPLHNGRITRTALESFLTGSAYRDGDKEGVVIKDYSRQRFAKLVRQEFSDLQKNTSETAPSITDYLTMQRLRKCALKLQNINTRRALNPAVLYAAFYRDVIKESPILDEPDSIRTWFDQHVTEILHDPKFH